MRGGAPDLVDQAPGLPARRVAAQESGVDVRLAGTGWPARLSAILDLLATTDYAQGSRWLQENPQEGNAYDLSKEVITVYAMRRAVELLGAGVRVNAVLPGPVETPILADFEASMGKANLDAVRSLVGRHATADDVAGAVVLLASDDARWINGHALVVDGGLTGGLASAAVDPAGLFSGTGS